jgi:hypothetical protein
MAMTEDEIRGDYNDLIDYRPVHSPTYSSGDPWILVQVRRTETLRHGTAVVAAKLIGIGRSQVNSTRFIVCIYGVTV